MAKTTLFDFDPTRQRTTLWHEEDGKIMIETRQDAEPIIEFVKAKAEAGDSDKDMRYLGEMPEEAFNQAAIEGWLHDDKRIRQWFRDNPMFSAQWHGGAKL